VLRIVTGVCSTANLVLHDEVGRTIPGDAGADQPRDACADQPRDAWVLHLGEHATLGEEPFPGAGNAEAQRQQLDGDLLLVLIVCAVPPGKPRPCRRGPSHGSAGERRDAFL
jgi:hypothetical protein